VEYTHHEVGPSQHEIDMRYADAMKMADDCMTYRITVKEYAMKYGWHATFMPKRCTRETARACTRTSRCSATASTPSTTPTTSTSCPTSARLHRRPAQARARDLLDLRPVVNSYKRLVPGFEAPVYGRVVAAQPLGARARAALSPGIGEGHAHGASLPGPRVQPYLTFAVLLQAGLEGIEKGYELPEPMEKEPLPTSPARSAGAWASSSCRRASAKRSS